MWPFKKAKTKAMTAEEFAATFPPAPCGEQTEHYEWTEIMGMACPVCAVQKAKREQEHYMEQLADKIAKRVLKAIKEAPME